MGSRGDARSVHRSLSWPLGLGALIMIMIASGAGCGASGAPRGATTAAEVGAGPRAVAAGTPTFVLQRGHSGPVKDASFSPDGRTVVTGGADGAAKLWDAATGALLVTLQGHSGPVMDASFSPDGHTVITASLDGTARLWDAATGALRATLEGRTGVTAASFSPDGHTVVTVWDMDPTAKLWDAATGALSATLQGHSRPVQDASFSPDGHTVITASLDGTARLWDAATGALLVTLQGHSDRVAAASFSPDGHTVITASSDGTARLWDAATGALLVTLQGHSDWVVAASFSPDGRTVVTASHDRTAKLWDAEAGTLRATLAGHSRPVVDASFSPDGHTVATASWDQTAKLWDAATGALSATLHGHSDLIVGASFSPDGRTVVTASVDGTARIWDAETGALSATLEGHSAGVETASFSPDGRTVVTASDDGTARIWDAETGALRATLAGHSAVVSSASFSPDGRTVVTASRDRTAKLWDAEAGTLRATLAGHSAQVSSASFSPDGHTVATASWDHTAKLWDAETGALRATLAGHSALVVAASFSPDGRTVVTMGGLDRTAKLWDAATGALRATLAGHSGWILAASFSPDGRTVLTASSDGTAKLWDAATGALRATLVGHSDWVVAARFSPDGRTLVTASQDNTAKLWDASTATLRGTLVGHSGKVSSASVSPDGRTVLTASYDGTAKLWDAATGTLQATFQGHDGPILNARWNPASRIMSLVGQSGRLEHFRYDADGRITCQYAIDHFDRPDGTYATLYSTPDGLFTGDEDAFSRVIYRLGPDILHDDLVTADQLFDDFHRPSLVDDFWAGRPLTLHPDVANGVGRPPRVEILGVPPRAVDSETIRVTVRAHSRGGGVAEVRLFANDARVAPSGTSRGLRLRPVENSEAHDAIFEQTFDVRLTPGENRLRAEGYSELGRVRGEKATATVQYQAAHVDPPRLLLFAMSLEQYADPSMALGSSNEDADAIVEAFRRQQGRLFEEVRVTQLRDAEATLEGVVGALERIARDARPQDVFVMYAAGHGGMLACGEEQAPGYRLLTYRASLRSIDNTCREALSMDRLTALLRTIRANKKLLVFDACQSGGAAESEMLVAMRGAEEVDAVRRLARSEGIAILAASKATEYAREAGSLGHGIFTYTLLRGLSGLAAGRDENTISVFSLIGYVDRMLPSLANRYAGGEQRATTSLQGSDFPLYALRAGDEPLAPAPSAERETNTAPVAAAVLPADVQGEIRVRIESNRGLITACLDDSPGVLEARVDASGRVTFAVRGAYGGTPAEACVRDALGAMRVAPGAGTMRVVVRP